MKTSLSRSNRIRLFIILLALPFVLDTHALGQTTETPAESDFTIREEMIPMRDGIRLYTLIISPKDTTTPLPVLLLRTPYNAERTAGDRSASSLEAVLGTRFMGPDYIYVFQDIRGRSRSEGDYFMYRAPRGPFNQTDTDETTDAWDSIDWLVKKLSTNGRVGIWGTSYPGWLTLAAMRDPHPALAAAVPFNPVVDAWKADDWFHWGAFRGAYTKDGGSLLQAAISAGLGFQPNPGSHLLGIGLSWGQVNENTYGEAYDGQYLAEVFYRVQFSSRFTLTPDLQFVINPALNTEQSSMFIWGIRGRLAL